MPFITFIYRIRDDSKVYYGKYCSDYISDDHEGLDIEVQFNLLRTLNKMMKSSNPDFITLKEDDVAIGVLSFSSNKYIPMCSSDKEIKAFDYYYTYYSYKEHTYMNGIEIIDK